MAYCGIFVGHVFCFEKPGLKNWPGYNDSVTCFCMEQGNVRQEKVSVTHADLKTFAPNDEIRHECQ